MYLFNYHHNNCYLLKRFINFPTISDLETEVENDIWSILHADPNIVLSKPRAQGLVNHNSKFTATLNYFYTLSG